MVDLQTHTIRRLFYEQVRQMTKGTPSPKMKLETFDVQFSDRWFA